VQPEDYLVGLSMHLLTGEVTYQQPCSSGTASSLLTFQGCADDTFQSTNNDYEQPAS
jgi:hypothetical protein